VATPSAGSTNWPLAADCTPRTRRDEHRGRDAAPGIHAQRGAYPLGAVMLIE
jgi:hypothetical protein